MSYPPPPPPPRVPPSYSHQSPIPVEPLGYTAGATYGSRPGILTAVGVISIVIASLSILASGSMGLWGFGMMVVSQSASTVSSTTVTTGNVTVSTSSNSDPDDAPAEDDTATDDGMPAPDRKKVVEALSKVRDLSPARQKRLDALLSKTGKKILPMSGAALTPNAVLANLSDSGAFPGSGTRPGADYFVFARGRIELSDDHASYRPAGAGEVVRVSASEDDPEADADVAAAEAEANAAATTNPAAAAAAAPAGAVGYAGLAEPQIRAVIKHIEASSNVKLNAAQTSALRSSLKAQGQQVIKPAKGNALTSQIMGVYSSNGTVSFTTTANTSVTLDKSGAINTFNFSNVGGPGAIFPKVGKQAALAGTTALFSLLLAILLMVAGILVLKNSPAGRRWHLIYAPLKLITGVLTVLAWWWFITAFLGGMPGGPRPGPTWAAFMTSSPAMAGLIYPIALLIVFNTKSVREYYNAVR